MPKSAATARRQADLSLEQMALAIPKIDRRIAEITSLMTSSIVDLADVRVSALASRIDALLVEIFGADTVDYERYSRNSRIIPGILYQGMDIPTSMHQGLEHARAQLDVIKSQFEEALADASQISAGKILRAFQGLETHPAIEAAAGKLFRDGHYSNAVEDAVKALNALVKLKSGVHDKDGTTLMEYVFSAKNPILRFNSLADDSDRDEQRGLMMLFSGAVIGLRNPRAHKLIKDDPERALEFIAFVSLLANLAEEANRV